MSSSQNNSSEVKRPNKIVRYKAPEEVTPDDPTADYMNLLGMVFSMLGLMMKVGTPYAQITHSENMKWCAWIAVFCSFISFSNTRCTEDGKQMFSSFMLSISAVVMSYLQNPQPMTLPWQ